MLVNVAWLDEVAVARRRHAQSFVREQRADDRAANVARPNPDESDPRRSPGRTSAKRALLGPQYLRVEVEPLVNVRQRHDAMINPADGVCFALPSHITLP